MQLKLAVALFLLQTIAAAQEYALFGSRTDGAFVSVSDLLTKKAAATSSTTSSEFRNVLALAEPVVLDALTAAVGLGFLASASQNSLLWTDGWRVFRASAAKLDGSFSIVRINPVRSAQYNAGTFGVGGATDNSHRIFFFEDPEQRFLRPKAILMRTEFNGTGLTRFGDICALHKICTPRFLRVFGSKVPLQ